MSNPNPNPGRVGRVRDAGIDARILAVAGRHLSVFGYERMSLAAVAQEAGTTRQALYRRWAGKAELAAAAVAAIEDDAGAGGPSGGPCASGAFDGPAAELFAALVAELADFRRGVSRPGRLSLVGTMLQETTDPAVAARYRARVIAPRRSRLLAVLQEAQRSGLLAADADLEVALTMCTGSWYGRALAGDPAPPDWPARTAALVWRALGGLPPEVGRR
ncbi:TetR/AcrR family transcriptional regulator [Kitasatospora paranensis]